MRFLESTSDAILNRSPQELIGALLIAAAVAIVVAGLYALGLRKSSPSPSFVGGLGLTAGAVCMALAAGYIEYAETDWTLRSAVSHPPPPRSTPGGPGRAGPSPWGSFGPGWSSGFRFVVAADENRDGRLTPEEVARLVRKADTDGDGSVNFRDIDLLIESQLRRRLRPPGLAGVGPNDREGSAGPPDDGHGARSSDDEQPSKNLDENWDAPEDEQPAARGASLPRRLPPLPENPDHQLSMARGVL